MYEKLHGTFSFNGIPFLLFGTAVIIYQTKDNCATTFSNYNKDDGTLVLEWKNTEIFELLSLNQKESKKATKSISSLQNTDYPTWIPPIN